jgi:hypothetical protein
VKKKEEIKILWAKQTISSQTLPFSPWAVLAAWLHVTAPYRIPEK